MPAQKAAEGATPQLGVIAGLHLGAVMHQFRQMLTRKSSFQQQIVSGMPGEACRGWVQALRGRLKSISMTTREKKEKKKEKKRKTPPGTEGVLAGCAAELGR